MAFVVATEIQALAKTFGINRLGFFTLTFKDHVTDLREAQKRFRSLRGHVIEKRYERAIGVWERHKSNRIHFHLVVVLKSDIRSGADFAAFKRKDYLSANAALRAEWAFWRITCPKYRFGRHELLPVKSNAEGLARYVGKYISKHVEQRREQDKGARVVRFIGYKPGTRAASSRFAWHTENSWLWRHKVAAFAKRNGVPTLDQLKTFFGPRWAYHLRCDIFGEQLQGVVYPSLAAYEKSCVQSDPMLIAQYKAKKLTENLPVSQTVLLHPRSYDGFPVWAVSKWFGEKLEPKPLSPEILLEAEERARELRLFAARMEPYDDSNLGRWD